MKPGTTTNNPFDKLRIIDAAAEKGDKRLTHQILDRLWLLLPGTQEQQQSFRSLLYRAWGGVLASEISDVTGVINPRQGMQHISTMEAAERAKCQKFAHALLRKYEGNITRIAMFLAEWSDRLDQDVIKKEFADKNSRDAAIHNWLNSNQFIVDMRTKVGCYTEETKQDNVEETKENNTFQDSTAPRSAMDNYIEALASKIEGRTDAMIGFFKAAADQGNAAASWQLWEYLSQNSEQRERDKTALEYLSKAFESEYAPAVAKVIALYDKKIHIPLYYKLQKAETAEEHYQCGLYFEKMTDFNEIILKQAISHYNKALNINYHEIAYVALSRIYILKNRNSQLASNELVEKHREYIMNNAEKMCLEALSLRATIYYKKPDSKYSKEKSIRYAIKDFKTVADKGYKIALINFHVFNIGHYKIVNDPAQEAKSLNYLLEFIAAPDSTEANLLNTALGNLAEYFILKENYSEAERVLKQQQWTGYYPERTEFNLSKCRELRQKTTTKKEPAKSNNQELQRPPVATAPTIATTDQEKTPVSKGLVILTNITNKKFTVLYSPPEESEEFTAYCAEDSTVLDINALKRPGIEISKKTLENVGTILTVTSTLTSLKAAYKDYLTEQFKIQGSAKRSL